MGETMHSSAQRNAFHLLVGFLFPLAFSFQPAFGQTSEPIKIGVIGEESSIAGASLTKAAVMAADDINVHGGVNGRKIESSLMTTTRPPLTRCAPSSAR